MYMSPREASRLMQFELSLDVREALASIRVPTLVLHPRGTSSSPLTMAGI
jgi:hypothetical protein